ncbi:MAG: AraC family transcriptional regulator [Streptomyces sp.]|nr:AraC family transcriptional regulator [Streptomyces sp.]
MVEGLIDHAGVTLVRFVLQSAAIDGADPHDLLRQSRIPRWMLRADDTRIPMPLVLRLLEVTEHSLAGQDALLRLVGRHYGFGALGLYDYLFTTSASLGEGLEASGRFMDSVATGSRLKVVEQSEQEITLAYEFAPAEGLPRELAAQFAFSVFCARVRQGTGSRLGPLRVGLAQAPPRHHDAYVDSFGTADIDFDQAANTLTLRTTDLAIPLPGADRNLAAALRAYAAALPPPPARPTTWYDRLQEAVDTGLDDGATSLTAVARNLCVSPRTLQRRLAEAGTTWRAELDAARRRRERLLASTPDLARRLGYSDPRSLRRARRRWDDTPPPTPGESGR